jgi:hypothetical protein
MQTESCSRDKEGIEPVLLVVDGAEWRFSIVGVDRIGPALLVRICLSGPEECAVAVQISGNFIIRTTAMQILDAVCAWLLSREGQTEGVIEIGTDDLRVGRTPLAH